MLEYLFHKDPEWLDKLNRYQFFYHSNYEVFYFLSLTKNIPSGHDNQYPYLLLLIQNQHLQYSAFLCCIHKFWSLIWIYNSEGEDLSNPTGGYLSVNNFLPSLSVSKLIFFLKISIVFAFFDSMQ